jgi:hypothetical protein
MTKFVEFFEAIMAAVEDGDRRPLCSMIEQGHPADDDERQLLVAYIDGRFKQKRGRKTPPEVERAARILRTMKRHLRSQVQAGELRIKNGRYHDAAVACTFSYMRSNGWKVPTREALDNYVKRAKPDDVLEMVNAYLKAHPPKL